MSTQPHDTGKLATGDRVQISRCDCLECTNGFWVQRATEFIPSYCPYCGHKFTFIQYADGTRKSLETGDKE